MSNFIDLTGMRYEKLLVVSRATNYEKFSTSHNRILKYARWNCICDCGNHCVVLASDLKSKSQISCGCEQMRLFKEIITKHSKTGSKEYKAWKSAKDRCYNPNNAHYATYGGRGITMQKEWAEDFSKFYEHIGDCPSKKHSLDRINSNGNYEENNVRWATPAEQARNTRRKISDNRYKYVKYVPKLKKYFTNFTFDKVAYTCGYFQDEKAAALSIYELYKKVSGDYPKYIDKDLIELGLIKQEETKDDN